MSKFMLTWLSDLVSSGNRTSTAFKQSQFNACATALNEHFQLSLNGDQIKNHNRTWKRKLQKIVKLKDLSGALWNEDKSMIVLDHEHYTNHIKVSIFLPFSTCWNWFHLSKILAEMSSLMSNGC